LKLGFKRNDKPVECHLDDIKVKHQSTYQKRDQANVPTESN